MFDYRSMFDLSGKTALVVGAGSGRGEASAHGIAAFGARAHVQAARLAEIVPDLPVMIVWIDTPERVARILPHIRAMVHEGLIAVEEVDVQLYATTAVPDLPPAVTVADVMTREVVAVRPTLTPPFGHPSPAGRERGRG